MATLTPITSDADGTRDTTNLEHDAGAGDPWWSHCSDAPDGGSSDWVANVGSLTDGTYTAWFRLENVDADFASMTDLTIKIDGQSVGFANDECDITARIADSDAGSTWLTDATAPLVDETNTTRIQPSVGFTGLTGSKAQWDSAYILFSWIYNRMTSADASASLRLFGFELTGNYAAPSKQEGILFSVMSPMGVPKQPYGSFAGKAAAGGGGATPHNPLGLPLAGPLGGPI